MTNEIKFCNLCNRNVQLKKTFSWFWFIAPGLFTVGMTSVIYLAYYFVVKKAVCPLCGTNNMSAMSLDDMGKKAILS